MRERRVGDDDVGLFEELDAFGAAEVAAGVLVVALEGDAVGLVLLEEEFDVFDVGRAVVVLVPNVVDDDGRPRFAEKIVILDSRLIDTLLAIPL